MSVHTKGSTSPLVSVIIPIYNVEAYLEECVRSVRNQTYTNLEIILVDDGSPDRCGELCDAYAAEDERIRVIHRQNGGLSAARNSALAIATGEFVTFIDSDDWIDEKTVETYVASFAQHPELDLVESRTYVSNCGEPCDVGQYRPDPEFDGKRLTGEELLRLVCLKLFAAGTVTIVCNKCFRRELIGDLRFPEGRVFEDIEFLLRLYPRVRAYQLLPLVSYYNRMDREGSITHPTGLGIIPKFVDLYENLKQILVEVEAEPSERWGNLVKADYRLYVASLLMTLLMNPLHVDRAESLAVRRALAKVQRPYVQFLRGYPYQSFYPNNERDHRILRFSYDLYLFVYLPLLDRYYKVKRRLRAFFGRA